MFTSPTEESSCPEPTGSCSQISFSCGDKMAQVGVCGNECETNSDCSDDYVCVWTKEEESAHNIIRKVCKDPSKVEHPNECFEYCFQDEP